LISLRAAAIALGLAGFSSTVLAQTVAGDCGIFSREAALMSAAHAIADGAEMSRTLGSAIDVGLKASASAQLAVPPERPAKPDTSAGSVAFASGAAGRYRISVTEPAWVDVVQGGRYLPPATVGGVGDCAGLRKSLTVDLGANAFVLQFSNIASAKLVVTLVPVE
jgi:hypothetical protein